MSASLWYIRYTKIYIEAMGYKVLLSYLVQDKIGRASCTRYSAVFLRRPGTNFTGG